MVSTTFTYLSRLRRDNYVDVAADTIHVADAVADTDETYGAYAAAENNTFNNANGSINNANNRNKNANYSSNNMYGQYLFLREDVLHVKSTNLIVFDCLIAFSWSRP